MITLPVISTIDTWSYVVVSTLLLILIKLSALPDQSDKILDETVSEHTATGYSTQHCIGPVT